MAVTYWLRFSFAYSRTSRPRETKYEASMSSPTLANRHPLRQTKARNRLLIFLSALAAIWFVMSNQRAEGACAVPNFTLASTTGLFVRAMTVADFNNDGKPDI